MEEGGRREERWQPEERSAQSAGVEDGGRGHEPRNGGEETDPLLEPLERNEALTTP